jgi:hypothetical protein
LLSEIRSKGLKLKKSNRCPITGDLLEAPAAKIKPKDDDAFKAAIERRFRVMNKGALAKAEKEKRKMDDTYVEEDSAI